MDILDKIDKLAAIALEIINDACQCDLLYGVVCSVHGRRGEVARLVQEIGGSLPSCVYK